MIDLRSDIEARRLIDEYLAAGERLLDRIERLTGRRLVGADLARMFGNAVANRAERRAASRGVIDLAVERTRRRRRM